MKYMLEVNNISKKFGKNVILDNINFKVKKNTIVGIIGQNGSGKSSLFKIILGLYKSDSGSVIINGFDLNKNFEKALFKVGSIIDSPVMYENMTAFKNLELFKKMFKGIDENKIKNIVSLVSLEKSVGKKVKTFSLGMKQRLALAQALLNKPSLLILDEPTNGLDPFGIIELRNFLKSLKNVTILISSHMLAEIENICDEIIVLKEGKLKKIIQNNYNSKKNIRFEVKEFEKAKKLLNNYNINNKIILKLDNEETSKLNKYLINNNINVYRIEELSNNLEKDFVESMHKDDN